MNDINEELTIDHNIYISVGLKNPMKPSTFKEIIDTLLFENIGYMTSWGTHTKDEWIKIVHDQELKIKSLKIENKQLQSNLDQVVGAYHEQIWNL